MQSGLQTNACVLDFAKAFNKASHHTKLIHKFYWYGITGEVNRWINNFLHDRTPRVFSKALHLMVAPGVSQRSAVRLCFFSFTLMK